MPYRGKREHGSCAADISPSQFMPVIPPSRGTLTARAMSNPVLSSRLAVFLFTDLVASTDIKSQMGSAAFAPLLARHNALFEQFAGAAGATVLKHTGDGFFAEFSTASSAVRAAL